MWYITFATSHTYIRCVYSTAISLCPAYKGIHINSVSCDSHQKKKPHIIVSCCILNCIHYIFEVINDRRKVLCWLGVTENWLHFSYYLILLILGTMRHVHITVQPLALYLYLCHKNNCAQKQPWTTYMYPSKSKVSESPA